MAERRFVGDYGVSSAPGGVRNRAAIAARVSRSRRRGRSYACDTVLERLAQDLQDVAAKLRQLIQEQHAMVRQRHLARQRHMVRADQPHVRYGVVRGATRAGHDDGGAVAGEAGDVVNARGFDGFNQGHGWQDNGQSA
jgi:hypothetical protein